MTPDEGGRADWADMGGNDVRRAARRFTEDFRLCWPQSGKVIVGRDDFAALNAACPAAGPWRFVANRIVAGGDRAVSDVSVTDGALVARAITVHDRSGDRIARQTECWPADFPPPDWCARSVAHGLPEP